jgi:two-component system, chemotaxis family, sensor kinase CheA
MSGDSYGVSIQTQDNTFVSDDVVIKALSDIRPKGIAGATLSGGGSMVFMRDLEELLDKKNADTPASLFGLAA